MRLLLPALLLVLPPAVSAARIELPVLPAPPLVDSPEKPLLADEARATLETSLPPGTKLALSGPPPATQAGARAAPGGEPLPVAAISGRYPVIDFADSRYARVRHDFLPVLADWFEALLRSQGRTPEEARAHGLMTNKAARLMEVFALLSMHRAPAAKLVPAIGWGRFHLNVDWGRCLRGTTHTFVVVGTERGWFLLDPYTRRVRALQPGDAGVVPEFIVL